MASPYFDPFSQAQHHLFSKQNNKEACSEFVTSSIFDLFRVHAIMKWQTQPKCMSPLNVVTRSDGKQHLILDLRHVNQSRMVPSFRMDSLNLLTDLADLDDLKFSLGLASGYHQVDMDPLSKSLALSTRF